MYAECTHGLSTDGHEHERTEANPPLCATQRDTNTRRKITTDVSRLGVNGLSARVSSSRREDRTSGTGRSQSRP